MFTDGATNRAVAAELGIGKDTAARYRDRLGFGPARKHPHPTRTPLTLEQKWATYTRPVEGGHLEWTGRHRTDTKTMVFTHLSREYTARSVAFRVATGRTAEGKVTAECDHPECVAPEHVADEPARTRLRAQYAAVIGITSHLTECTRGHDVATHRRYDRAGRAYCGTCHAEAAATRKAAA
ncbi:hypothetical protein OG864_29865 [Streptomyces sp. NBC_00124]|uniref:hypothetical protein n=1 Tax=Streptomyces sp. NBC_00124 TaxID=2975662 RepID=UPI002254E7D2|nr:hypothetical protein [Streptomyces sp. NBC_00124]MCX5362909.1 hypothetical protein [Streptomyces sp. NBC_00124]